MYFALALLVAGFCLFSSPAHAYIDPGTGSILIQSIIAGIAGALFAIKIYWRRVVGWTKKKMHAFERRTGDEGR